MSTTLKIPNTKQDLLKRISSQLDDYLLYGRPMKRITSSWCDRPNINELKNYRREHLSDKIHRAIDKILSRRRVDPVDSDHDIIVEYNSPWSWQHEEMDIRGACFGLVEESNARWFPHEPGERNDGWLLVENARIVGAAEFLLRSCQMIGSNSRTKWLWVWVYVDPEHRRKGVVTRRLPLWQDRYGDFIIDQPNPHSIALLEKAGAFPRHEISTEPRNGVQQAYRVVSLSKNVS